MGFLFTCLVVVEHCPCPCHQELLAIGIPLEGIGINDAFVEEDFVSFGFFDGF